MRAAVLAGGIGTRLRPYTAVLPKPLVPVGDRPILELILRWLADSDVDRVDVCIGHLGELIQTYFTRPQAIPSGLDVHWQWEREPLGTAGALAGIRGVDETLLVVNGDVLTDLDPAEMLAFHRAQGSVLTIATRHAKVASDLGVVEERDGLVTAYREKPMVAYTASMGIYLYEPRALAVLPDGPCQFPELVLELLARGEPVAAFPSEASWHHIGNVEQHLEATLGLQARLG